jgi:hypothetical protein
MVMDVAKLAKLKMVTIVQEDPQPEEIHAAKKYLTKLFFHQVDNPILGDKSRLM